MRNVFGMAHFVARGNSDVLDLIPYLPIFVGVVLIVELLTGRLVYYGVLLGTRRATDPSRYWKRIRWQVIVLIALICLAVYVHSLTGQQ